MGNWRNERGQAMVEVAFLFPLILLTLAVLLQLVLVIHMQMRLHRTAMHMAAQLALGQSSAVLEASALAEYRHTFRWGIPVSNTHLEPLKPWRRYKGKNTTTNKNCMAMVDLSYRISGDWYAMVGLRSFILGAHAELPCEPADIALPT